MPPAAGSAPAGRAASTTGAPGGTTRSAFSSSPSTTCRIRPGSVYAGTGPAGTSTRSSDPDRRAPVRPGPFARRRTSRARSTGDRFQREVGGLQPGQRQQVADQPVQVLGLGEHRPAGALATVVRADHPVGERLGVPADRGQRGAQLVRDRQQELALPALAGGQRGGQPVQRVRQVGDLVRRLGRHPYRPVAGAQPGRGGGGGAGSAGPAGGPAAARRATPAAQPGQQRQPEAAQHLPRRPVAARPGSAPRRRRRAAAAPRPGSAGRRRDRAGRPSAGGDPAAPPGRGRPGRSAWPPRIEVQPRSSCWRAAGGPAGPRRVGRAAGGRRPAARRRRAGPARPGRRSRRSAAERTASGTATSAVTAPTPAPPRR